MSTVPVGGEAERFTLGFYREFEPPADLRPFVAARWSYSRPFGSAPIPGKGHRLLPDADLSIAYVSQVDERGRLVDARVVIRGPVHAPAFFAPPPGYRIEAIRLRPEWCRELIGVDPLEHLDAMRDIECVDRRIARQFAAVAVQESVGLALVEMLRSRAGSLTPSRNAIVASGALARMRQRRTAFATIARDDGISERQLRRIIQSTAGFGPKYIQRVSRLQRAVIAADAAPRPDWAAIASDAGFYDQSHMIEQFSTLACCTPAELFRERRMQ
jgi:AraC-like DNA-binding protein